MVIITMGVSSLDLSPLHRVALLPTQSLKAQLVQTTHLSNLPLSNQRNPLDGSQRRAIVLSHASGIFLR